HHERRALAAAREVAGELAPGHPDELLGIANFEAKLTGAAKRGIFFRAGVAHRSRQRVAKGDLQLKLLPLAVGVIGDVLEQRKGAVKLSRRFSRGTARNRNPCSFEPRSNRALGKACVRQMMRYHLGLHIDEITELLIVYLSDPRMQRLPLCPQQ